MRNGTLEKYSDLIEYLLTKTRFDIRDELSKRNISRYIGTSLLKLNLIRKVYKDLYMWNIDTNKADSKNIAKIILHQRMEYDKIQRGKKKKAVQGELPMQIPNKMTVEDCINFLKSQTDYTYEIYRIERNKL